MSPLEPRGEIFADEVTVPVGRWLWVLDFSGLSQVKDRLPSDTTRSEQLHANRNSVAGCLIPLHLRYVAFYRFQDLLYDLVLFLVGVPYRKRLIGHSLRSGSCFNLYFVVLRFGVRLVSEDGGRVLSRLVKALGI
jgi:hypothetical protein